MRVVVCVCVWLREWVVELGEWVVGKSFVVFVVDFLFTIFVYI